MRRIISIVVVYSFVYVIAGASAKLAPLEASLRAARSEAARQVKPAAAEIKIDNFSFSPSTLSVPLGTTVTWTNRDDIPHTVVSSDDPKLFKSKVLDTDEKFAFTFTKPGTYPYFCSVHPKMTGKVTVQ